MLRAMAPAAAWLLALATALLFVIGSCTYDTSNLPTNVVDLLSFEPTIPDPGVSWYQNMSADIISYLYTEREYHPSAANKRGHNMGQLWGRPNEFDVKDKDYTKGLIDMGIVLAAFGLFILICVPIIYCFMARVECCCRKEKEKSLPHSHVRWWYVWVSLCTIGFSIVYMCGIIFLDQNINEWEDSVYAIGDAFGAVSLLSEELLNVTSQVLAAYTELGAVVRNSSLASTPEISLIVNATGDVAAVQARIDDTIAALQDINGLDYAKLQHDVYDVADSIANTDHARRIICYTLMSTLLVVLVAYVFAGWYNFFAEKARRRVHSAKCASWFSCLASPAALMVVVACMVLTGASVVISAGTGDYCQDPDYHSQLTLNEMKGTDATTEELISYYITCNDTAALPIEDYTFGVRALYLKGLNEVSPILSAAYDVGIAEQDTFPEILQTYDTLDQDLFLAWVAILKISLIVECPLINQLYTLVTYDTMCESLSYAVNVMFAGALGLSITLAITMVLYHLMIFQKKVEEGEEAMALVHDMDGADMPGDNADGKEGEINDGDGADDTVDMRSPLRPNGSQKGVDANGGLRSRSQRFDTKDLTPKM